MTFMVAAGIGAAGALAGGLLSSKGASSAAKTQANAAIEAARLQKESSDASLALQQKMYNEQVARNQPYISAGSEAQNRLMTMLGLQGDSSNAFYNRYGGDFSMQDFQQDPGYQFRLSEGLKSLDRTAAARGGLLSGSALKAATRYGQDMASQEYGNAFQRYQTNRSNQLAPLGSLMASGQNAANNTGAAGQNFGQAGGNAITSGGNALATGVNNAGQSVAAGQLGTGNTWNNALGSMGSMYQNAATMNALFNRPATTTPAAASTSGGAWSWYDG